MRRFQILKASLLEKHLKHIWAVLIIIVLLSAPCSTQYTHHAARTLWGPCSSFGRASLMLGGSGDLVSSLRAINILSKSP